MPATTSSLGLSITNPLVLYRALLATQRIRPDPAQHRLALELQQLYFRLKDYNPEIEYRWRLEKAARISRANNKDELEKRQAVYDEDGRGFSLSRVFGGSAAAASMLAMTRTVPVYDSAMEIDSPQGMLLYGEVGRGKSMLLDMLYSSLPNEKKRRWHFNTFILDMFRRLELARIERSSKVDGPALEQEHVVLSLARDTMEISPILFMDEFQMPDRVSAKLVHSFFTNFFSLGGVLIASSNRIPDELAKASGIEFSNMGSAKWGRGGRIWEIMSPGQKQARSDFGKFVDLLKRRCEVWEMEGERDWRREDDEQLGANSAELTKQIDSPSGVDTEMGISGSSGPMMSLTDEAEARNSADHPQLYFLSGPNTPGPGETSNSVLEAQLRRLNPTNDWKSRSLTVYAREIKMPVTSTEAGVVVLPFNLLCASYLGAADYISIASTFHTLVVRDVPILTLLLKNEARRFITFLDACYEARCRLIVEAAAPPDRLFFPETRTRRGAGNMLQEGDSIESEAFSEMYQDSTAPFRPNVSVYQGGDTAQPTMSLYNKSLRSVLADEDADFGPTYGNGRSHGMSSEDFSDERAAHDSASQGMAEHKLRQGPDFTQGAGIFTGQDEQFAYKRARSRLWEMCGRRWWKDREGPAEDWWTPVQQAGRFWEKKKDVILEDALVRAASDVEMGERVPVGGSHDGSRRRVDTEPDASNLRDNNLFKHGASPFRTSTEPPPKFGWQHAWGLGLWGKRAGEWGKGVQGDRQKDRSKDTSS